MGDLDNLRIISENDAVFPPRGQAELFQRIAQLGAEIERLRAEVATLRADRDHARGIVAEMNRWYPGQDWFGAASDGWRVGQPVEP